MCITKVNSLKIESFRRFKGITLSFGDKVTLIAGQNGTAKSTLLGMLAQPFSFGVETGRTAGSKDNSTYTDNYHGLVLSEYRDFTGGPFMYNCDNVFRLSKQYDKNDNPYQYRTVLSGISNSMLDMNTLFTRNRRRTTAKGVRFVTGPGASHKSGEGNFPHPVIYLGLNRLWPLAVTKSCTFTSDVLSEDDKKWYVKKYNEILCLDEYNNHAKYMSTAEKKKFITPESNDYDGESCSAGQDNLSQILTAILSFRALKNKLKEKYRGGMLLIDELDATLHAFAQRKLLEILCEMAGELSIQIIATTHSLVSIKEAYCSALSRSIELLYLSNSDNSIVLKEFNTYQDICDHLRVESTPPIQKKYQRVSILFEDERGKQFFNQVCGSKLCKFISVVNASSFGAGHLKNLADLSRKLPELENVIFVPDGDMAKEWERKPKNLIVLPGDKRPETLVFGHLFNMKENDPFWEGTYTKQFAITSKGGSALEKGNDKDWVKRWFDEQSAYWGRGNNKVFKSWVQCNKKESLSFFNNFIKLLKGKYKGEIPKEVIEKIRKTLS